MITLGRRESTNVIDRRAFGPKSLGIGGLVIGSAIIFLMGGNPLPFILQNMGGIASQQQAMSPDARKADDQKKSFAAVVLADTEDVWSDVFRKRGAAYRPPQLVLFRGAVESACGNASSAAGPFYCRLDHQVYLDLGFLDELSQRLGASGDFAGAYVIAHEVGHHIQNLLGLEKSGDSVHIELQADCLAGVWARQTERAKNVIEAGDVNEALGAAAAVGDDRLQMKSQGYVVPDSFTHGSSDQRVSAFKEGYNGGELSSCGI